MVVELPKCDHITECNLIPFPFKLLDVTCGLVVMIMMVVCCFIVILSIFASVFLEPHRFWPLYLEGSLQQARTPQRQSHSRQVLKKQLVSSQSWSWQPLLSVFVYSTIASTPRVLKHHTCIESRNRLQTIQQHWIRQASPSAYNTPCLFPLPSHPVFCLWKQMNQYGSP